MSYFLVKFVLQGNATVLPYSVCNHLQMVRLGMGSLNQENKLIRPHPN